MEDKNKAIDGQPVAAEKVTLPVEDDAEAKITALEAEKAKLEEEKANYRLAFLKEKSKKESVPEDESEDDKIRRIALETLATSRLAEINREKDALIAKTLKENKELKLAQLNKTSIPASIGVHSEAQPVRDTAITSEQLAAFKSRGWTDKDIERYKKNLMKYGGR